MTETVYRIRHIPTQAYLQKKTGVLTMRKDWGNIYFHETTVKNLYDKLLKKGSVTMNGEVIPVSRETLEIVTYELTETPF